MQISHTYMCLHAETCSQIMCRHIFFVIFVFVVQNIISLSSNVFRKKIRWGGRYLRKLFWLQSTKWTTSKMTKVAIDLRNTYAHTSESMISFTVLYCSTLSRCLFLCTRACLSVRNLSLTHTHTSFLSLPLLPALHLINLLSPHHVFTYYVSIKYFCLVFLVTPFPCLFQP